MGEKSWIQDFSVISFCLNSGINFQDTISLVEGKKKNEINTRNVTEENYGMTEY